MAGVEIRVAVIRCRLWLPVVFGIVATVPAGLENLVMWLVSRTGILNENGERFVLQRSEQCVSHGVDRLGRLWIGALRRWSPT